MKPKDVGSPQERRNEKQDFGVYFGKHLRKVREAKNISQEKLSLDAGFYHTYVNKMEQGHYSPSLHTIWRLAHALGLTLADFFKKF